MTPTRALPTLALLLLTAWAFALPAAADDVAPYDPLTAHGEADKNADGQIDRREFYDRMVEVFYFADRDKDGHLVIEELTVIREPMVMKSGDRDGDGKLSMKEYVHIRYRAFDAADANDDGELSKQEVISAFEN